YPHPFPTRRSSDLFPDPEEAEAPVNLISAADHKSKKIHVFILNYPEVDTFDKAMNNLDNIEKEIKERYKENFDINVSIEFNRYDREEDLIIAYLDLVNNQLKNDF